MVMEIEEANYREEDRQGISARFSFMREMADSPCSVRESQHSVFRLRRLSRIDYSRHDSRRGNLIISL